MYGQSGTTHDDHAAVLASSAAIYGHPKCVPVKEVDPKTPTSPYGPSKLAVDHYAQQYHERDGFETVALRYFNTCRPAQTADDLPPIERQQRRRRQSSSRSSGGRFAAGGSPGATDRRKLFENEYHGGE